MVVWSRMSEYLTFVDMPLIRRKTRVVEVHSKTSNDVLGIIKWWPAWRQYCFFPEEGTVWSIGCMHQVHNFILDLKQRRSSGLD